MMITLDQLAHRYQCLPSQALAECTTFDLKVLQLANAWQHHQQQEAQTPGSGKSNKKTPSTAELQAMVDAVRNKK